MDAPVADCGLDVVMRPHIVKPVMSLARVRNTRLARYPDTNSTVCPMAPMRRRLAVKLTPRSYFNGPVSVAHPVNTVQHAIPTVRPPRAGRSCQKPEGKQPQHSPAHDRGQRDPHFDRRARSRVHQEQRDTGHEQPTYHYADPSTPESCPIRRARQAVGKVVGRDHRGHTVQVGTDTRLRGGENSRQ